MMEGPTGELYSCVTCRRPDSAQSMVACDECSQWQHYGCAGVTATIADRSWLCCRCVASHNAVNFTQTGNINSPEARTTFASARAVDRDDNTTGPISGRQDDRNFGRLQSSSNSNAGSVVSVNAIAHLRLRHLKEQKDLEDQKAERDREFLARKQQLEAEIALEELNEGCDRSVGGKSHRSIAGWVEQQCGFVHTSTPVQQKPETVAPSANPHPAIQQREERQRMQAIIQSGQQIQPSTAPKQAEIPVRNPPPAIAPGPRSNYLDSNPRFPPVAQNPVPPVPVNPLTLPPPSSSQFPGFPVMNNPYGTMYFPNIPDMPSSGADYQFAHPQGGVFINNPVRHPNFGLNVQPCAWQASEQHPPTVPPTVSADLGKGFPHATGRMITPQQLAARQVVSRDLPKFSGDPLEWPMFLSAFESTTAMCGIQPDENLARLQKSLVGSAREKVQNILMLPDAIPEIIDILRAECGRPDQIVYCLLSKIRKTVQPSVAKLETLVAFGREVRNMVTYMQSAKLNTHLDNPLLLAELVAKLPPDLQLQWGMNLAALPEPSLGDFCAFVSAYRTAACKVKLTSDVCLNDKATKGVVRKEKPVYLNAHSASVSSAPGPPASKVNPELKPCLMCKSTTHRVRTCKQFETLPLEEKLSFISEIGMCRRCLAPHGRWPCRNKQPCGINGCPEPHHKLLHPGSCSTLKSQGSESSVSVTAHHQHQQGTTFFKILPVTLHANGKSVSTFAFLDDGSDLTLVEDELIDELGLVGERIPLCLQWTSNVTRSESNSRKVEIGISGASNNRIHQLANVRTVESLELPKQSLDYESLSKQFPHLSRLPISSYRTAVPRILIGVDNAQLNLALKKRERSGGEPIAAKFRLGWAIFGGRRAPETIGSAFVHVCERSNNRELHEPVQQYLEFENLAISGLNPPESDEDRRARRLLEKTTVHIPSGKFQTGLLWKSDEPVFPNKFTKAVRRRGCFEKRLLKDPELKTNIDKQMNDCLHKRYVHKATSDELRNSDDGKIWHLPISAVRHPSKLTKVRVFWDAAATYGGIFLSSQLLKGPDLVKPLLSVLCQFRQKQYAIAGDIREMFQLIIRPADRNAQRYLYQENSEAALDVYMDVATFGAMCSSCSAQFAKNGNAQEHKDRYPEAAETIVDNTNVDVFFASCAIEEATKLALELSLVNRSAGFEIPRWQSHSKHVLKRVGVTTGDNFVVNMENCSRCGGLPNRIANLHHLVHRFKRFKRDPVESSESCGGLNRDDCVSAETAIWRAVQRQVFAGEIQAFRSSSEPSPKRWKRIGKGSVLAKLSSMIDESGVLRKASRIDHLAAHYSFEVRNPEIVPKNHDVTTSLMLRFYQRYGHATSQTVLNEIKLRYYIPRMRASSEKAFKTLSHHQRLDDEGLRTLLSEAELIVNSHLLTFVPLEDPKKEVLTPNHFLWLSSGEDSKPPRVPIDDATPLRPNWKVIQHLTNQFWKRWVQAYLPTIACRTKWFAETRPLKVGDLVVIVDESVRNGWLRGKVVRTYPGRDGQVHKVDVETCDGSTLQRPAVKVALLDVQEESKVD
ncbi:uncharacterized protein LOC129749360 [Uranotaenia lowii]|uniref:uncharacterized protein LOC129749360 n=1 Tax=Uranotaenia lowii TaxID=190385 RepID=UPI002479DADC|nr:uncharacterized protein LOC129749360 [Uranotaenia lowii]